MIDLMLGFVQDVFMLSLLIWREARGEPYEGKAAAGYTVMNRARRPSWWGNDVLSVITKKWQYSSLTDPHDPQLTRWPTSGDPEWMQCMKIAEAVYEGTAPNMAPGADSYYAVSIPAPKWADPKKFVAQIGNHRFYDLDSDHEVM